MGSFSGKRGNLQREVIKRICNKPIIYMRTREFRSSLLLDCSLGNNIEASTEEGKS